MCVYVYVCVYVYGMCVRAFVCPYVCVCVCVRVWTRALIGKCFKCVCGVVW